MLFPKRKYKKKPNSLLDYADAYFRALIFTELFIVNNKGALEFNPKRMSEIDEILKEYEKRKIFDHENISKFYVDYYGRPSFYILPNENKTILSREIEELFKDLDNLLNANKGLPERFQKDFISLKSSPKIELSYRDELEDLKKDLNSILYCVANKNPVQFRRIIEYFNKIIQRDEEIYDPPAYLEWNTWRIFNALDDATKIIPNFRMGANLMPLSCAGGNRVDIELHYKTFAIGVEVTLTRGERQWIAEGYPVPRHIANLTDTASGLPVYGLFVAPTISSETKNVFFDAKTRGMFGKKLSIIPMDLDLFKKTIGVYENKSFEPDKFKDLLVSVGTNGINEEKWFDAIPQKVDNWLATF